MKRTVDGSRWRDPSFRKLPPHIKAFWSWLNEEAVNHAGLWRVDWDAAEFFVGCKIDPDIALDLLFLWVVRINDSYWLIPDFIKSQCGVAPDELSVNNGFHRSVRKAWEEAAQILKSEKPQ